MERIIVSKPALCTAGYIMSNLQTHSCSIDDNEIAHRLGYQPDTIYKAIRELTNVGAITHMGRRDLITGQRNITVNLKHWVWFAVLSNNPVSVGV